MKKILFCLFSITLAGVSYCEEVASLERSDNIPVESVAPPSDSYFEGYVQALIDMHYFEYRIVAVAKDHEIFLHNLPKNQLTAKSIISFVRDIPGVKSVKVTDEISSKEMAEREKYVFRPQVKGVWFPQTTELFLPLIANPRQVIYSIGYRGGDKVCGRQAVPVDLGDDFPIFRWLNVGGSNGDLQIGIETGIWSVFDIHVKGTNIAGGTELVNTDYYVGFPLSYAINKWAFKARVYHISSHLGDEFLVNHPGFHRVNPSFEAFDIFVSYQANDILRLYVGPGYIIHSDHTFPMKKCYFEYGYEARFGGQKLYFHKLYGNWVSATHFRSWQVLHFKFDMTTVFGYEWSKLQGVGRKMRLLAEYHKGFSVEGQFFKKHTSYGSFRLAYGF